MLSTIVAVAITCLIARKFVGIKLVPKPCSIANTVANTASVTRGFVDQVRLQLMSRASREREIIRRRAQMMYDNAVADIFQNATDEEKQTLLDLFAKYGQPQS